MNDTPKKRTRPKLVTALMETFGFSPAVAFIVAGAIMFFGVLALIWVFESAPPRTITVTSGPAGSTFQRYAERYQKALAEHGVTLKIVPSLGSQENLERLQSGAPGIDIGFVQGGVAGGTDTSHLVSLGSIAFQPLLLFYRAPERIRLLSELAGKRVAIGAIGSGTRALALALLEANEIKPGGSTTLLDLDAAAAANALVDGKVDAVFLMGDSAPLATLRSLFRTPGIQLYDVIQADAYTRRFPYLNRLNLPEGSIDFGKNLPARDIALVAPTVELVARKSLHPALTDLLLEVAQELHGNPGIFQKRGQFPAPLGYDFKISDEAHTFYKSGKGYLYSKIGSFWLASVLTRILVVFVPFALVLIPALRFLPSAYRFTIMLRIYRCYRPLLRLERDLIEAPTPERRHEMRRRLDEIEEAVNRVKVPASFADQFYELRTHIAFVRSRLV
ncbi:MAG TPA: TAXI family TRAP transporter solute-binding subunit [Opitutaceae bacterium]|nr:TAXI family TRAP transporter solute-binding subunit [Opitutaceae bacterium]